MEPEKLTEKECKNLLATKKDTKKIKSSIKKK